MKKRFISIVALAVISCIANAAEIICGGTVEELAYHSPNRFMVRLSSMNTRIFFCNPDATWTVSGTNYTTGPETCKQIFNMLMTMKVNGSTISRMYIDGDSVPPACDQWGAWEYANIRFFTMN